MCEPRFQFRVATKNTDMDDVMVTNERHCYFYVGDDPVDTEMYRVQALMCQQFFCRGTDIDWRDCGILRVVGKEKKVKSIPKATVIAKGIITKRNILHVWTRDLQDF